MITNTIITTNHNNDIIDEWSLALANTLNSNTQTIPMSYVLCRDDNVFVPEPEYPVRVRLCSQKLNIKSTPFHTFNYTCNHLFIHEKRFHPTYKYNQQFTPQMGSVIALHPTSPIHGVHATEISGMSRILALAMATGYGYLRTFGI